MGATSASVTAWIAAVKWPAKVLKSLGPLRWLVGAAISPASEVPCFNGAPVLLSRVQRWSRATNHLGVAPGPETHLRSLRRRTLGPNTAQQKVRPCPQRLHPPLPDLLNLLHCLACRRWRLTLQPCRHFKARSDSNASKDFTKLRGEVQTLNSGLASQLQASLDSLRSAQQSQERQTAQGMEELKALTMFGHAKKQRATNDDL